MPHIHVKAKTQNFVQMQLFMAKGLIKVYLFRQTPQESNWTITRIDDALNYRLSEEEEKQDESGRLP